jgi:hypothetical protein
MSGLSLAEKKLLAKAPADWAALPYGLSTGNPTLRGLARMGLVELGEATGPREWQGQWRLRRYKHCSLCGLGEGEWRACDELKCGELL